MEQELQRERIIKGLTFNNYIEEAVYILPLFPLVLLTIFLGRVGRCLL